MNKNILKGFSNILYLEYVYSEEVIMLKDFYRNCNWEKKNKDFLVNLAVSEFYRSYKGGCIFTNNKFTIIINFIIQMWNKLKEVNKKCLIIDIGRVQ